MDKKNYRIHYTGNWKSKIQDITDIFCLSVLLVGKIITDVRETVQTFLDFHFVNPLKVIDVITSIK